MATPTQPPLGVRIFALLDPLSILIPAAQTYLLLMLAHVLNFNLRPLFNPSSIRDESFAKFWTAFTTPPPGTPRPLPTSEPPQSDPPNPAGSAELAPLLFARAHGNVLELGPGSGAQLHLYRSDKLRGLYAAEPAAGLHGVLRQRAEEVGLSGKMFAIEAGTSRMEIAEALAREGVQLSNGTAKGAFDTVVSVRVLCSVPDARATARDLYDMLKPGGELLMLEHVVNPWNNGGSAVARVLQSVYMMMGWAWFVGGCDLCRDTEKVVREAGVWEKESVEAWFGWSCLNYVRGVWVKPMEDR